MNMRTHHRCTTAVALLLSVVAGACTKSADTNAGGNTATATMDTASAAGAMSATGDSSTPSGMAGMEGMKGMENMKGMEGMHGMMDSTMGGMSGEMHARMMSMSGDSLKSMLPMHRQMVANMIAKMNGEMRDMKMASTSEWPATVDSLRKDLVRMPELGSAELKAMMPMHMARVMRLGEMHQTMMRAMGGK